MSAPKYTHLYVSFSIVAIVLLAVVIRVWGISFGLPQRTHIDEPAYVVSALKIASGNSSIDYPTLSPNLYQGLLVFVYGLMYVYHRVIGIIHSTAEFGQLYLSNPSIFYISGRLTSVLISACNIMVVYLLARKLMNAVGSIAAASILSFAFIDVRHAHFIEPYALISLLVTSSIYFGLLITDKRFRYLHLFLCSALAGIAFALRLSMLPVLFIPWIAMLVRLREVGSNPPRARYLKSSILLIVLGTSLGYVVGFPGILFSPGEIIQVIKYYGSLSSGESGFLGFKFYDGNGWSFYFNMFSRLLGIPAILLSIFGLVVVVIQKERLFKWLLVLFFPIAYIFVISFSSMSFLRYSVPLMPALCVLMGISLEWISKRTNIVLAFFLGVMIILPSLRNDILHNNLLTKDDTRLIAKRWIEDNIPSGSKIAQQWFTPVLQTDEDPEAGSTRNYRTFIIDPFSPDPKYYQVDYYISQGFDYLILSNYIYEIPRTDSEEDALRNQFLVDLEQRSILIAEIVPKMRGESLPYTFEESYSPVISLQQRVTPGPQIRIYQLAKN